MRKLMLWLALSAVAHANTIQVALKVVDENGMPIPAARAVIQCRALNSAEPNEFTGETDASGCFSKKVESWSGLYFEAKKAGYYSARLYDQPDDSDVRQEIILPRRINPRPLFVKFYNGNANRGLQIPKYEEWFGYDFKIGDWVTPNGQGTDADVRFRFRTSTKSGDPTVELSALDSNGGFAPTTRLIQYSELKMPHSAPTTGYQNLITLTSNEDPMSTALFIRSRVKTDATGKITSANFGKIQGPVIINRRGCIAFTHYFNPSANDPNLEFDPSRNLLNDPANPPELAP